MESKHDDRIDWDRLDRYVCGVGSPAERAALAAWVCADAKLRQLADAMRTVGRPFHGRPKAPNARVALRAVQRRLRLAQSPRMGM
jgi:hypothetical protein